ncbi:MAG: hypothetical protein DI529_16145 [Chryseobacterium sp.]|nr:MAG: hypothetical protein DI529_16145 [Chryseobacterium sp.]
MEKILFSLAFCFSIFCYSQAWEQMGQKVSDPSNSSYYANIGCQAMSSNGNVIATAYTYKGNSQWHYDGSVSIYDFDGNQWQQMGTNIDFTDAFSLISLMLSDDGKTLAIGYRATDDILNNGYLASGVRIYKYNGTDWILFKDFDYGGTNILSISINSDASVIAIANSLQGTNGMVSLYKNNGSDWISTGELYGEQADDDFGYSIKLSSEGNTLIIGTPFNKGGGGLLSYPGAAYIYKFDGAIWKRLGQRIDGDSFQYPYFGGKVNISPDGKTVAIGIDNSMSSAGYMRIYRLNGNVWGKLGSDFTNEQSNISDFNLSGDGNIIAVGKYAATNLQGTAGTGITQIYQYICSNWELTDENKIYGTAEYDRQGLKVNISNDAKTVTLGGRSGPLNFNMGINFMKVYKRDFVIPSSIQISTENQQSTSIDVGQNLQLKTCIYPAYSYQDLVWSISSGTDKASINQNGIVTGLLPGIAIIRASSAKSGDIYGEIQITVKENMAVSELHKQPIAIYPNPTSQIIHISDIKNIYLLELYAEDGKLLKYFVVAKELDLSNYSSGNYILKITYQDGTISDKKIIKK